MQMRITGYPTQVVVEAMAGGAHDFYTGGYVGCDVCLLIDSFYLLDFACT